MGLDITVIIADPSPFTPFPPQKRLSHLRATLLADDTGLWGIDAPCVEEGWVWPEGANSDRFALYEFPGTLGSYKPHFWAGERWDEGSCPAPWCRGSRGYAFRYEALKISAEAAVHEAPCWGELNPRSGGTTVTDLRIPVP